MVEAALVDPAEGAGEKVAEEDGGDSSAQINADTVVEIRDEKSVSAVAAAAAAGEENVEEDTEAANDGSETLVLDAAEEGARDGA